MPIADDEHRSAVKRFNATLVNHLFLLYFDTRAGYGDTGPYPVPGAPERSLLVRDFYRLAHGDFPWSDVAKDVPYHHLTAALVLEGVDSTFTDFGTSNHTPEDYLDRLVAFGLYTTDGLPPGRAAPGAGRRARRHHRRPCARRRRSTTATSPPWIATRRSAPAPTCTSRFLRPFAEIAGVADELDWTVPRDLPEPLYQLFSVIEGENASIPDDVPYYDLYPEEALA